MIRTLSLCPTCYKKIPADIIFHDGAAWMMKKCDQHGEFSSLVDRDASFVTSFYKSGTLGRNKSIIVHSHNQCNMKCSWCYYPMGEEQILPPEEVDQILGGYRDFGLMLSGGEPTIDPFFFDTVKRYQDFGWSVACITNMLKLADRKFVEQAMDSPLRVGDNLNFACSLQHPKNYSQEIKDLKFKALHNLEIRGLKPACIMFSIQDLDELDFIEDFYSRTKGMYPMLRIRGMFRNWGAKGIKQKFCLSDLYKAFCAKFSKYVPTQSVSVEHSNMYCLYMNMEGGQVSLSCAPDVYNVDYHQCSRPVFMLARDRRCYPVPLAQIINEGISRGWKDGFELKGATSCMQQ